MSKLATQPQLSWGFPKWRRNGTSNVPRSYLNLAAIIEENHMGIVAK